MLGDGLDSFRGDLQRDPLVFLGNVEALFLKVREESSLGFIVRVRNAVTNLRSFPCNLTNSCHISQ